MTIAPPGPRRALSPRLPKTIRKTLQGVDRRLRMAGILRGLGRLLLTASLVSAGVMAVEFFWPIPEPLRWAVWGVGVGVAGLWFLGIAVQAVARRPSRSELAAVAERAWPGGGERLSLAVSLVEDGERAHGSPELIEALVDRTAEQVGAIDARLAVPLNRAWRSLAIGLVAAGLVALPAAIRPDPFAVLALRVLAPWSDLGTAGRVVIDVDPGDTILARGDSLTVSALVRPRFGPAPADDPRLEWIDAEGVSHELTMGAGSTRESASDSGQAFTLTIPSVGDTITYRISAGPSRSRPYRVSVVDPPRVVSQRWTITPPAYTGLEGLTIEDPTSSIVVAWQDSLVTISATTNQPASRVTLAWPSEDSPGSSVALEPSSDGESWTAKVRATASGRFTIDAEGTHTIKARSGPSGRIEVQPDSAPVVAIGEGAEAAGPGDLLSLPVASRDDFAVARAELHYAITRAEAPEHEPEQGIIQLELDGLGTAAARGIAEIDLAPLALTEGDELSVRARVLDNRPAPRGPNEGWSHPRPVTIVADLASHDAERRDESLRPIREALEALARQAAEDRLRLGPLRAAADAAQRDPRRWSDRQEADLEALAESAQELVDQLHDLAASLEDDAMLGPIGEALQQAAEAEAEAARSALEDARAAELEDRGDDLRRAEQELAAASDRLDNLSEQLDDLARAAAARPELADLARQENDLADRAEAMAGAANPQDDPEADRPPIDPEALGQLREAQEQLAQALNELIERTPALGEAAEAARAEADAASRDLQQASDPSQSGEAAQAAAEAMRRAAEQLRQASGPADPNSQLEQLARRLADSSSSGSEPSTSPTGEEPEGPPSGSATAGGSDPNADLDLRSDRLWGALPGHLRTEMLRSSTDRYHPDYAPLIRLYFEEIARASSAESANPPEPLETGSPPPTP